MAGFWEKAKYWLDIGSSHGVGVKAVSEVCPRAGGLSRRRLSKIIIFVVVVGGAVVVVVDEVDIDLGFDVDIDIYIVKGCPSRIPNGVV